MTGEFRMTWMFRMARGRGMDEKGGGVCLRSLRLKV